MPFAERFVYDWWHCGVKNCVKWHTISLYYIGIAKDSMYYINHKCDGFFFIPLAFSFLTCVFFSRSHILFYLPMGFVRNINNQQQKIIFYSHLHTRTYIPSMRISILSERNRQTLADTKQNHFINMLSKIVYSVTYQILCTKKKEHITLNKVT